MLKLTFEHDAAGDRINWHITDGPIDHHDWTAIFKGDSIGQTLPIALQTAMAYYYAAADRISKDGP